MTRTYQCHWPFIDKLELLHKPFLKYLNLHIISMLSMFTVFSKYFNLQRSNSV